MKRYVGHIRVNTCLFENIIPVYNTYGESFKAYVYEKTQHMFKISAI